jgi:hypothetical protein
MPGLIVKRLCRDDGVYSPEAAWKYSITEVPTVKRVRVKPFAVASAGLSMTTVQLPGELEIGGVRVIVFCSKVVTTGVGVWMSVTAAWAGRYVEASRVSVTIKEVDLILIKALSNYSQVSIRCDTSIF